MYVPKIKTFLLLILFWLALSIQNTSAFAESPVSAMDLSSIENWNSDWTKCEEKSECELIGYGPGCYWLGAVNKKSKKEALEFLSKKFKENCKVAFFDRLLNGVRCSERVCILK